LADHLRRQSSAEAGIDRGGADVELFGPGGAGSNPIVVPGVDTMTFE
jgi:hypothetical protein